MKKFNLIANEKNLTEIKGQNYCLYGTMYGDDECFEDGMFYQYFVTLAGNLLKVLYDIPDGDLDTIEYSYPKRVEIAVLSDEYICPEMEIDLCFDVKYWNRFL